MLIVSFALFPINCCYVADMALIAYESGELMDNPEYANCDFLAVPDAEYFPSPVSMIVNKDIK